MQQSNDANELFICKFMSSGDNRKNNSDNIRID